MSITAISMNNRESHLITPPTSAQPSRSIEHEKAEKAQVVNNFIQKSAYFISSLWHTPTGPVKSLFSPQTTKFQEFEHYLKQLLKRSKCSMAALQSALFYLSKLEFLIKSRNVDNSSHLMCPKKVFLICLILSYKYNYDFNYSFKSWSRITGLSIVELKNLEIKILQDLKYDLNLNNEKFTKWVALSEETINESTSSKRAREDSEDEEVFTKTITAKKVKLSA